MNVIDLFSGIGGFSLGLERAGMRTVAFCEIDGYCQDRLADHWPGVPVYSDVRDLTADRLRHDGIHFDAMAGGFPCQDASLAQTQWGQRVGIHGERTGLWRQSKRLAADFRPEAICLENVPGLLSAGFGTVLGDLAEIGFDAEWRCIPASKAGLPHRRDRLWVVAYPGGSRLSRLIEGQSLLESAEASLPEHGNQAAGTWRALDRDLDSLRGGDGVSVAVERRRIGPVGNAVCPPITEAIGRAIMRWRQ
jgi:DNA (cytosine-5)-methyltransferase 1